MTYAKTGVDIYKEERAIKNLLAQIKTKRNGIGKPLGGHYAGIIEFGEYALVLCTDGVGSKVLIASALKKWDTIGIDCIAMNVNDAICVGAEPLAFVDYIAIDDPKPEILREIGEGLEIGAKEANISIIGGETASLPELIKGFDLAGTCLSYVKKDQIITGNKIRPGDIIIGLKSNGLHSNGYTLARKIIEKQGLKYTDYFPNNLYPKETIGEVLLKPTKIYVKPILSILGKIDVKGLAHITGGGVRNLLRLNQNVAFVLEDLFEPQPIFSFLQENGNVELKEMYQTFNMGTGFMIIVSEDSYKETIGILRKTADTNVKTIGYIEKGEGVHILDLDIKYH